MLGAAGKRTNENKCLKQIVFLYIWTRFVLKKNPYSTSRIYKYIYLLVLWVKFTRNLNWTPSMYTQTTASGQKWYWCCIEGTFFLFLELSFLLNALLKRFSETRPEPMSSSDSWDSSFFTSVFFSSAGTAVVEGAGLLLGDHQRLGAVGQVQQPPHGRWGSQCWHWPEPVQTNLARKSQCLHRLL